MKNNTIIPNFNSAFPRPSGEMSRRAKPGGVRANEKSRTPTSVTNGKQRVGGLSGGYGGIDKGDGTGAGAAYKRR
jgi:hypothetical protein